LNRSGIFKIVIAILGLILLIQQIVNYNYIKRLDKEYSDIITDKLNILQSFELTSYASEKMQRAMVRLSNNRGKKYDSLKNIIDNYQIDIQANLDKMKKYAVSSSENVSIDTMETIFNIYKRECYNDLIVLRPGTTDSTQASKMVLQLRETYNDFMSQQIRQSRFFVQQGEKVSNDITANTNKTSVLLLVVGILPFIALALTAIVALITLIILGNSLNWFRSAE